MISEVIIRKLKMWEVGELLRFRARNDYNAPGEHKQVVYESPIYACSIVSRK